MKVQSEVQVKYKSWSFELLPHVVRFQEHRDNARCNNPENHKPQTPLQVQQIPQWAEVTLAEQQFN